MNARDRIADVVFEPIQRWGHQDMPQKAAGLVADAVLALLPNLLTDPDVIATAAEATDTAHVRTGRILAAAAEALTGGAS